MYAGHHCSVPYNLPVSSLTSDLDRLFKAYDVRGLVANELTPAVVERIGAAFSSFAAAPAIAIGSDCRPSSPALTEAFAKGVRGRGTDVVDLGSIATDMLYYFSGAASMPGAMITASHNPPEWNGIKFCLAGASPVGADTGLAQIKALAADPPLAAPRSGSLERRQIVDDYIEHLLSVVEVERFASLRVGVDAGNGMAGVVVAPVFRRIPTQLYGLYLDPDGTFPNHPADPLRPENLADLLVLMEREHLDLGVAFDGDADRAFFVDDRRQPLSGSTTTALIARWFLARSPGSKIVHNLICSRAVPETVIANGGIPVRTRVGHSYIKAVMAETGAVFGGEHSGHYYFRANYRADSGMLAMLVMLQVISEDGRPLSVIRQEVEPYAQSGEINLVVSDQPAALVEVTKAFDGEVDRTDGLTMSWKDRWFNLRPSNTEPVLRLNVEAADAAAVRQIVAEVERVVGGDVHGNS